MSSAHSPTFTVTSPTSQLILQPFYRFTYVTAHSPTLPLLHLRHSSFSNPSFVSPTSQVLHLIQSSAHFPTFQSLHLRHNSFSNPSIALPTSQLILQPFRCFTYVTARSPTLISLLLRHRIFTYVTWRAAHGTYVRQANLYNHVFSHIKCLLIFDNFYDHCRLFLLHEYTIISFSYLNIQYPVFDALAAYVLYFSA